MSSSTKDTDTEEAIQASTQETPSTPPSTAPTDLSASARQLHPQQRPTRRPGYTKPTAPAPFSASARARQSVMSLPGIDHLQHYFARTKTARQLQHRGGGAGALLPPGRRALNGMLPEESLSADAFFTSLRSTSNAVMPFGESSVSTLDEAAATPLPPSPVERTYSRNISGDVDPRRRQATLQEQVQLTRHALTCVEAAVAAAAGTEPTGATSDKDSATALQASSEVAARLRSCVRAAREYGTALSTHHLARLTPSQRHAFGEGALRVMACLASFVDQPDVHASDWQEMRSWVQELQDFLEQEEMQAQARAALTWLQCPCDDAGAVDRLSETTLQRHHAFLVFHDPMTPPLTSPLVDLQRFLMELRTGLRLCLIFNHFVNSSTKPFGAISQMHSDTSIQWRVTDNLSYWRSAVAYRLGIDLTWLDVKRVYTFDEAGQQQLHSAVAHFCEAAIQEVVESLKTEVPADQLESEIEALRL